MAIFKKLGWIAMAASMMVGAGLCTACGEDDNGDSVEPGIFQIVQELYDSRDYAVADKIIKEGKCTEITSTLTRYASDVNGGRKAFIEDGCKDYKTALDETRKKDDLQAAKKLASDMMNSGYYMAAYVLADDMQDHILKCDGSKDDQNAAKAALEQVFDADGCENFLTHATKIADARGR